jgi:hypothetical protein
VSRGTISRACVVLAACVLAACAERPTRAPAEASTPTAVPPSTPSATVVPPPPATPVTAVSPTPVEPPRPVELAPGLRIDRVKRRVEIDGTVPVDAGSPEQPVVFLEWLVCTPDTKEHESLVVTSVRPSLVHAALLSLGLDPGAPGSWEWQDTRIIPHPPTGACVRVLVRRQGGVEEPLASWVADRRTGRTLVDHFPAEGFVFAGSRTVERQGRVSYRADLDGGMVGLACFSTELIAFTRLVNPDASLEEPVWIADPARVPPRTTPVTVIIEACNTR